MKSTFGIFTKSLGNVKFGNMRAAVVDGISNPNHPGNPGSPNTPRVSRYPGYQNPELGDAGKGKIGRWQQLKLDALATVIDQIIEQYLKDKTWYGKVRCREALWNMYRRLEWWIAQQTDPSQNDYQRALQMIKDCIYHILEEAQDPELAHNISLPLCPAPYYMSYHGDYFNHYDGNEVEVKLFDSRDLPVNAEFPGLFRYVSSTEDQEWKLVHSVGTNESTGSETILKMPLDRLVYGNSSKITFNWRFKQRGRVRFKYMASAAAGNGLLFFINNDQVGGEWNQSAVWQTATFNVVPGQTYKLDWMVRRQSEVSWGNNAVYIKDIECLEVIRSLDPPTPPDFDTLGSEAFADPKYEWTTFSNSSVVRTYFGGVVTNDNRSRTLAFDMDSECDGTVTFAYRMGVETPVLPDETALFFIDDLTNATQTAAGKHGSRADKTVDSNWSSDGKSHKTIADAAVINYELLAGPDCTLHATGAVEIVCPPREVDYYVPTVIRTLSNGSWSTSGPVIWRGDMNGPNGLEYVLNNPIQGASNLSTTVTLTDDGWFNFTFDQDLRPTETFEVLVDGLTAFSERGKYGNTVTIPLLAGTHTITFRVRDTFTELPKKNSAEKTFAYNSDSFRTPLGSKDDIKRTDWGRIDNTAQTFTDGAKIVHTITLNPGAAFTLSEMLEFLVEPNAMPGYSEILHKTFNDPTDKKEGVIFSGAWQWEDFATRENLWAYGDGAWKVEPGVAGYHTATIPSVSLSTPGIVSFEYGGEYGRNDYMMVRAGSTVVFRRRQSTGVQGTLLSAPLPAGTYPLVFTYFCANGAPVFEPPTIDYPTNPDGEVCYSSGSAVIPIDYNLTDGDLYSDRTAHVMWGGSHVYPSPTLHATDMDGATITRDFYAPPFGALMYSERLDIQAGKSTPITNVYPVKTTLGFYNNYSASPSFPSINVKGIKKGQESGYQTDLFHTDGQVEISFQYITYIVAKSLMSNTNNLDSKYRACFRVYLVPEGGVPSANNMILEEIENRGKTQQVWWQSQDWTNAGKFHLNTTVPAGKYRLIFTLRDTFNDRNTDDNGLIFYAAFDKLELNVYKTQIVSTFDDTAVKRELINLETGAVINTITYSTQGAQTKQIISTFSGLQSGVPYQVRYTLLKGTGTEGGLYNNGGSFSLHDGYWNESWAAYCINSNGQAYPKNQSTQVKPPTGTTVKGQNSFKPEWGWLDSIFIYEGNGICADTRIRLEIKENGMTTSYQDYYDTDAPQEMKASIVNNSDVVRTYTLEQTFSSSCGAGALIHNGVAEIKDSQPPPPSFAKITDFSVTNNKAIWIGGCDGSTINVKVVQVDTGTVIFDKLYTGAGLHGFDVSGLSYQPYSKYRLTVTTDQKGVVSAVTGKAYMTIFKLVDARVFEIWKNTPLPFNGRLDFYIDGTLKATFTTAGGFYTVSFPFPKGRHTLRWTFTELGNGNVYDNCEIDFLQITNWICDRVKVVPYCDPGGGDKCVEELIKCLLKIWNDRPKACMIGKRVWLFT